MSTRQLDGDNSSVEVLRCVKLTTDISHHSRHIPVQIWAHQGSLIASPGELYIGGQEHFYLETNCTIAVPKGEAGEMELFVGTQNTMKTQVSSRPWWP